MTRHRWIAVTVLALAGAGVARAATTTVMGGGGPKRVECVAAFSIAALGFPDGKPATGATCADGDPCDQDGVRNGVCQFAVSECFNVPADGCTAATVNKVTVSGLPSGLQAAIDALGLPLTGTQCTPSVPVNVAVKGPDKNGEFKSGSGVIKVKAKSSRGVDKDQAKLVCRSGTAVPTTTTTTEPPTTTSTVTTTTLRGATTTASTAASTTTTTVPLPIYAPGAGLKSTIQSASVAGDGTVTVQFTLTDDVGLPISPTGGSNTDPRRARMRFTIARLEARNETAEDLTTTFTAYVNYITTTQTSPITHQSSDQPTYDSGGTFTVVDGNTGVYRYTFKKKLPQGYPAGTTHTIGAQVERPYGDDVLAVNPLFSFVPAGGAVTLTREVTTTAQCNGCHDRLGAHGGNRREVGLCQLCHTDQAVDPDTGHTIEFKAMIHRIHRGKDLPSLEGAAVGEKYEIIGFNQSEAIFAERVPVCVGGALAGIGCTSNADCPSGTCTGVATEGVGFPRDLRDCGVCHTQGANATNYKEKPSTAACTGCHDDVNPSEGPTEAGPAGTNHVGQKQPDALCRLCHTPTGAEFDVSVPGAHTIPERSTTLAGLSAELLSASGTPGGTLTVKFRLRDGQGTAITDLSAFNSVAFAFSGPSTDFGGGSKVVVNPRAVGSGKTGTLSAADGNGVFTYETTVANGLPADATGTWRIGLEARRPVTVNGSTVNEAPQNPVLDFSADGSDVTPRRTVVETSRCSKCHGTFSQGFSVHGNLRNRAEYCVICHNPNNNDSARRIPAIAVGADAETASIDLKHMIHKIHTGEDNEHKPYVIYGFGTSPTYTPHDFAEVRYPGDRRDCSQCHAGTSYLLPLPAGVLPTRESMIVSGTDTATGATPPIQDACLTCHTSDVAQIHADTNTTAAGAEACAACHGDGRVADVAEVHAIH